MVNLSIEETSGVDHPAHLHEGWLVMKAASEDEVAVALDSVKAKTPSDRIDKSTEEDVVEEKENEKDKKPSYEDLEMALKKAEERISEMEKEMGSKKEPKESMEDEEEDFMKSAPDSVRKAYESMQKAVDDAKAQADVAETELRKERADRADAESVIKARTAFAALGLDAEQVGPALRRLADNDSDLAKSVEDVLTAANAKVESADIFSEIGKSTRPSGSAYEKAEAMAKAAVVDGKHSTIEQALTDVFTSDSELYKSYLVEQGK
jgi:chromosome segregation ATPase